MGGLAVPKMLASDLSAAMSVSPGALWTASMAANAKAVWVRLSSMVSLRLQLCCWYR